MVIPGGNIGDIGKYAKGTLVINIIIAPPAEPTESFGDLVPVHHGLYNQTLSQTTINDFVMVAHQMIPALLELLARVLLRVLVGVDTVIDGSAVLLVLAG